MASGGKRGGADRVLESRHLVGLFLGVVLLCGVFFTLGYVMGRTQYGGSVHAESPARNPEAARIAPSAPSAATPSSPDASASSSGPAASEWDFYTKKDVNHLDPVPSQPAGDSDTAAAAPAPSAPAPPAVAPVRARKEIQSAKTAKGAIVLQVAALRHQSDALAMASLLQQKRFPSFVSAPAGHEALYRVQVGPYSDERAADAAKTALDRDGFKAIIKR